MRLLKFYLDELSTFLSVVSGNFYTYATHSQINCHVNVQFSSHFELYASMMSLSYSKLYKIICIAVKNERLIARSYFRFIFFLTMFKMLFQNARYSFMWSVLQFQLRFIGQQTSCNYTNYEKKSEIYHYIYRR